jgi:hypothetical protein
MSETFLNKAQLTGLSRDARRTEILRAKGIAELDGRVTDLEALTTPTAWTNATLLGTWTTSGGQVTQYRKVGDEVQVRFHVAPGVSGTAVFTLPVGYRPPNYFDFPAIAFNGVHNIGAVFVQTNGNILLSWTAAAVTSISTVFSFSVTP